MFTLSPRLSAAAELVPCGSRVADIGTDHAYLPIRLLYDDRVTSALACDISEPCVERARRNAERYGMADRLTVRRSDGLFQISPSECDTIVLAGIGGETIRDILLASPWGFEKRLVCVPASRAHILRRTLYDHGMTIVSERIVEDAGRYYPVFAAEPSGDAVIPDAVYDYASPALLTRMSDPLTRTYLTRLIAQLARERAADHTAVIQHLTERMTLQ